MASDCSFVWNVCRDSVITSFGGSNVGTQHLTAQDSGSFTASKPRGILFCFKYKRLKSYRDKPTASAVTIFGNDVADATAKLINKQDIQPMQDAADQIYHRSRTQQATVLYCI